MSPWRVRAGNRTTVHDLHATILHLTGLDHTKLTYCQNGRDMRLTDVYAKRSLSLRARPRKKNFKREPKAPGPREALTLACPLLPLALGLRDVL